MQPCHLIDSFADEEETSSEEESSSDEEIVAKAKTPTKSSQKDSQLLLDLVDCKDLRG